MVVVLIIERIIVYLLSVTRQVGGCSAGVMFVTWLRMLLR